MKVRLSEGRAPDWDIDLQYGREGERHVARFLHGMRAFLDATEEPGRLTVEVKNDRQAIDTGNLWIEVECRRADGWHDSGIRTSKADMWALVLAETLVIGIQTRILRVIADRAWEERDSRGRLVHRSEETDGSHPTRGVRLPLQLFLMRVRTEMHRQDAA